MKNLKTLLTTFTSRSFRVGWICLTLIFATTTKAQDDTNCGILIDSVLAESIPSWGFNDMDVVFPMKDSWKGYDIIEILFYTTSNYQSKAQTTLIDFYPLTPEKIANFEGSKLIAMQMLRNDPNYLGYRKNYSTNEYCKDCKDGTRPEDVSGPYKMYFTLVGHKISGYQETLDGNTIVKTPVYDAEKWQPSALLGVSDKFHYGGELLYQSKPITISVCNCIYDKSTYKKLIKKERDDGQTVNTYLNSCEECKENLTKSSPIPGKKMAFKMEWISQTPFSKIMFETNSPIESKSNITQPPKKKTK